MSHQCKHGQLARTCLLCEYEQRIAELEQRIANLERRVADLPTWAFRGHAEEGK